MINKLLATKYNWGKDCSSWMFCDSKNLSVKFESMPANTSETKHKHKIKEQFFFILTGKALFHLNGLMQTLNPKEGIFVAADSEHYIVNENDKELEFLVITTPNNIEDRLEL